MAALSSTKLTLLDWAKRTDPNGSVPIIANLLSQTNEILADAVFKEGNLPTGHRVTMATGLPTVYYRALNEGVPSSKSKTVQVDEDCAILEARSEVDIDLLKLNGNSAAFRMSEARMFLEAMNQQMADTLFYGNRSTNVKEFMGLAPRYSSTSAGNGENIIDAGGTDEFTSVWLVCWGEETVFCPFPKGSTAGLLQEDLGRQTSFDATDNGGAGRRLEVMAERFQWKAGLAIKDWRYVVRIGGIDTGDFASLTGKQDPTAFDHIIHLMMKAIAKIPNLKLGKPCFYMNRTVFSGLMRLAMEKSSSVLALHPAATQFGTTEAMLTFMGVPIRQCDALINTESDITA